METHQYRRFFSQRARATIYLSHHARNSFFTLRMPYVFLMWQRQRRGQRARTWRRRWRRGGRSRPAAAAYSTRCARGPPVRIARALPKSVGKSQSCMLPTLAQGSPMGLGVGSGYGSWAAGAPVPMWEGGPKWWTVSPMSGAAGHIRDIRCVRN